VHTTLIALGHHVEQKGVDIIVQRFRSQKQLGHETQILAVHRVLPSVDLKYRNGAISVDLIAWRMLGGAFHLIGNTR